MTLDPFLHPRWRDMSEWVVHFTDEESAFRSILQERAVRAFNAFGWAKSIAEMRARSLSACLSEIPLDHLDRLYGRHGRWGVGFRKSFVTSRGGARVWYVERQSALGQHIFDSVRGRLRAQDFDDVIWDLLPFVDAMADGEPFHYRFDWEREWRVPGGITFDVDDLAFVMTPSGVLPAGLDEIWGTAPCLSSAAPMAFAESAAASLGTHIDQMLENFRQQFRDPVHELYWDGEAKDYFWTVPRWGTAEAVEWVFPALEDGVRDELIVELERESYEWCSLAELSDSGDPTW